MKIRFFETVSVYVLLMIVLVNVFFPVSSALALGPFGGNIVFIFRCLNGLKITITPPTPGDYMYIPGTSRSYLYGPPSHIGQWLLGSSGPKIPCLVPCPNSGVCVAGYGDLIDALPGHGSSI